MGKHRSNNNNPASANNLSIANQQLLRILSTPNKIYRPITHADPRSMALQQIDRRAWKPDISISNPGAIQRKHSRLVDTGKKIRFAVPNKIAICVRRKQRKEILFAKKLTRKGSGSNRRNRNFWSDVKC